ncbi:MAG: hypothetical protein LBJ08_06910, partial [Bifidobacteriaceae bacterium]|nr:hypothetical protein [Bifidobacteriaceae bacterium]
LHLPSDLTPQSPIVGLPIVNTVASTAQNSEPDEDSTEVTVRVPSALGAAVAASWNPSSAVAAGSRSTIAATATNTSNGAVESLTVLLPAAADDGVASLGADNPFELVDFEDFGACPLPEGAQTVTVDAYVFDSGVGAWTWRSGAAGAGCTLPGGVGSSDVAGLRVVYAGTIALDAEASIEFRVVQRATGRETETEYFSPGGPGASVVAPVGASVALEGQTASAAPVTAAYGVDPASLAVVASASFLSNGVTAGDYVTGELIARNDSGKEPVKSIGVAAQDFADQGLGFAGFAGPVAYPAGATSGQVVYSFASEPDETVPFADGSTPNGPAALAPVTAFAVEFRASAPEAIQANASAKVRVRFGTRDAVAVGSYETARPQNTAIGRVEGSNGGSATASHSARVAVVDPKIEATIDKALTPDLVSVGPNDPMVASLHATVATNSGYVRSDRLVVEDALPDESADQDAEFWNGFDLVSIPSVAIPGGTVLSVALATSDDGWVDLELQGTENTASNAFAASWGQGELAAAAAAAGIVSLSDVTGVRFTFVNTGSGFASGQSVNPYVGFTARSDLRHTGAPTAQEGGRAFVNFATAEGRVNVDDGAGVSDRSTNSGEANIGADPGAGGGSPEAGYKTTYGLYGAVVAQRWLNAEGSNANQQAVEVNAQAGQVRSSQLLWDASGSFSVVRLTAPADAPTIANVSGSVFDAFDLVRVMPIDLSDEPKSNGWALKYDQVCGVELYVAGVGWKSVTPPAGGWSTPTQGFVGFALVDYPDFDPEKVIGLRLELEENYEARDKTNPAAPAYSDALAPAQDSGITNTWDAATGALVRWFTVEWQLRNQKRSNGEWVTATATYNYKDDGGQDFATGVVRSTVRLDGTRMNGRPVLIQDSSRALVFIADTPPSVTLTSQVGSGSTADAPLVLPSGPGAPMPGTTVTFTGRSASTHAAKASYLRISEPAIGDPAWLSRNQSEIGPVGAKANPFAGVPVADLIPSESFFDRFTLEGVSIDATLPAEVDWDASLVWLVSANGTATSHSVAAVQALSADALADIVGISVTFQGVDVVNSGGSISVDNAFTLQLTVRVRTTLRGSGAEQSFDANTAPVRVDNWGFVQSYDPVQFSPCGENETGCTRAGYNGDLQDASLYLAGGRLQVAASRTIRPSVLAEPERDTPLRVEIGAHSARSNAGADTLTLLDDPAVNADFWNNVRFTALTSVTTIRGAGGADRVRLCVYGVPADMWTCGPASAPEDVALPPSVTPADYSAIQGLRAEFTRDDGGDIGPYWTASLVFTAELRTSKLDGSGPVAFPGAVASQGYASATRGGETVEESGDTDLTWVLGERRLGLNDDAGIRKVFAGDSPATAVVFPYTLTVANTGDRVRDPGYVSLRELKDTLPQGVHYVPVPSGPHAGEAYELATSGGTGVSTISATPTFALDGAATPQTVTFGWPSENHGNRLNPGQSVQLRIYAWLELGRYAVGETARNVLEAATVEELDSASNTEDGGPLEFGAENRRLVRTWDDIGPQESPNFRLVQGVHGAVGTAVNEVTPS